MQELLLSFSENHIYLIYVLIMLLACLEGPILSVLCGLLIKAGYVKFWPVYLILMLGDILRDIVWYWIGKNLGHRFIRRFGHYIDATEEKVSKATALFHKHKNPILIISKVTNGLGLAIVTLIAAGMAKVPFKNYLFLNFIGQLFWTGLLVAAGYFFGSLYEEMEVFLGKANVILLLFVLALVLFFLYKYVRAKILERANLQ